MDEGQASRQRRAYGYAALTICCWATVSTAFKVALAGLHHAQVLLLANAVAVCVLVVIVLPRGGLQRLRALPLAEHGRCVLLGIMNPAAYYLLLFQAYALLPIALVLKEPIAPSTLPGVLLILGGLAIQQRFARPLAR